MADAIQNIRQAYRSLLQNDSQLSQLKDKLIKGDLSALQKYSMRAGQLAVNALQESVSNESIDQSSIQDALDGVFRENYDAVVNAASTAQKALNQDSGIGLNASESDYSSDNVQALADKITSYDDLNEGLSNASNDIVMQSQRYADDSERRSAQFDNDSGLEVLVTREYDDVGVHTTDKGGGQPCQWCLDRCGTDVPYEEAYERGMFERHPGCGCIITYKTRKGILRQGKGDWQNNSWSEVPDSVREHRINFSNRDPETFYDYKDVTKIYLSESTPGLGRIDFTKDYNQNKFHDEVKTARLIHKTFGGNITCLEPFPGNEHKKRPDYIWNENLWELKNCSTAKATDSALRKGLLQIKDNPGGIVIELDKDVKLNDAEKTISQRMNRKSSYENYSVADVMLVQNGKILKVIRFSR